MIQANAASFPSKLGGSSHGYLGLTIENANYLAATGHNFVPHTNLGLNPLIPATGATGLVIAALERTHKNNLRNYREQRKLTTALRNQLVNAFELTYLKGLEEKYVGFLNRTIPAIFKHLYDNYGKITAQDLEENDKRMKKEWNPDTPIEELFE